jgi:hypothetical protein
VISLRFVPWLVFCTTLIVDGGFDPEMLGLLAGSLG